MKFTRYPDQYLDINGHNFLGIHAIMEDRILLHSGCSCHPVDLIQVNDGEVYGPDEFDVTMTVTIGYDDEGGTYATIELSGPEEILGTVRRQEEVEGQRLQ